MLPKKCWIEIDRDQPNKGIGIFHYRSEAVTQTPYRPGVQESHHLLRRFEVRLLRTSFVGSRGQFSCFSHKMRVPMKLTEAIDTPSNLINREMNCDSEEGSHAIRRSVFTPVDVLHNPIGVEQAIESSAPPDVPNAGLTNCPCS